MENSAVVSELEIRALNIRICTQAAPFYPILWSINREIGLDNNFSLYRKDVELDDELLNLELVKVERTLRTFERYCTSGCEVLVTELKEVLKG